MLPLKSKIDVSPVTESLSSYYGRVRQTSLDICAPLEIDDYNIQSMPDVSPPKWHLAHTSWFFETFVLKPSLPAYLEYHPRYNFLFNSYYEQIGAMHARAKRGFLSRPTVAEIFEYRKYIDHHMQELISNGSFKNKQSIVDKIILGLNHEQQHQELLYTDILHIFASNPLAPKYRDLVSSSVHNIQAEPITLDWISYDESLLEYGFDQYGFCYDNELPIHKSFVQEFKLASRLTTNAEYLDFINDRGYSLSKLWLSDAWETLHEQQWQQPLYWKYEQDRWFEMTLGGLQELDMNAPVSHLSYYEADAYATWCGLRLPTEYEWEHAAKNIEICGNFSDSDILKPVAASNSMNLQQMFGDLWQWTKSPYTAYPGFQVESGAIGEYNGKFMSKQMVVRGGSCVTSKEHIRKSYRNFFYPENRWQFSGIRLAK